MTIESRLEELGVQLRPPSEPAGNYVNYVQTGNLLYLAGAGPGAKGKVGADFTTEEAARFARSVAIQHIAAIKDAIGDLDRVSRFVKVLGMVNAAPDFEQTPAVIDGYSNFIVDVFGDKGLHARSAVGMVTLPFGIPVEVEAIVEVLPV